MGTGTALGTGAACLGSPRGGRLRSSSRARWLPAPGESPGGPRETPEGPGPLPDPSGEQSGGLRRGVRVPRAMLGRALPAPASTNKSCGRI